MDRHTQIQLRSLLADLYPDTDLARMVAADAGLTLSRIKFNARADLNWAAILSEAEKANRLDQLVEVVQAEYGDNPDFQAFYQTYRASAPAGTPPAQTPGSSAPAAPAQNLPPLTGRQHRQLSDALLNAFSGSELQQLVRVGLEENLNAIAGGSNLSETVFNLIEWAERRGRTAALLRAARNERPQDPALRALQSELGLE